jgi:hypothetical protein
LAHQEPIADNRAGNGRLSELALVTLEVQT